MELLVAATGLRPGPSSPEEPPHVSHCPPDQFLGLVHIQIGMYNSEMRDPPALNTMPTSVPRRAFNCPFHRHQVTQGASSLLIRATNT